MADLGHGHEVQQAVHHTQARTQDGNDGHFSARDPLGGRFANRGFNLDLFQGDLTGDLITHQQGNLIEKLAEILGTRLFVTHDGQFVLHHRMVDNVYFTHS